MDCLTTERLRLRPWCEEDFAPFAAMNADPVVMEHFPNPLSQPESDGLARKLMANIEKDGWGLWAVSVIDGASFIGFVGLDRASLDAHFTPAIEVGWRLAKDHWGQGYATEGARAALAYGFKTLGLDEIVSFTAVSNERSIRVMKRLGMHRNPADDFDNPKLAEGHPLRRHVLYRLRRGEWFDQALI